MPGPRPLIVTADEQLLDDLLRLAAAAGAEADVVADAGAARSRWGPAPLVLVGADAAAGLCAAPPPRRDAVVLVGDDLDDGGVWERAVVLGAEHVVFLPDAEPWLVDRIADAAEGSGAAAMVVGVVGGRGGAGASVLAASLALSAARRGLATTLLDADPLGGGIDLLLGAEHVRGLRWQDLAETRGRVAGTALRDALPEVAGLTVLAWDRAQGLAVPPEATRAVAEAARRSAELVVVDLPRHVDRAGEELLARCATTVLVVPAEVRAVAAAGRVAAGVALLCQDVRVVVRRVPPSRLRAADVGAALGLPVVGEVAAEPGLAGALESGRPPLRSRRSPLAGLCATLLDDLLPLPEVA